MTSLTSCLSLCSCSENKFHSLTLCILTSVYTFPNCSLFISKCADKENLLNNQKHLKLVIIPFILMTLNVWLRGDSVRENTTWVTLRARSVRTSVPLASNQFSLTYLSTRFNENVSFWIYGFLSFDLQIKKMKKGEVSWVQYSLLRCSHEGSFDNTFNCLNYAIKHPQLSSVSVMKP